jgi:nitrate reductase gamma subunit
MTETAPKKVKSHYYQLADYNLAICGVFLFVNIVAVGLRVWSRRKQKLRLQLDDWLVFPALVLIIGSSITMIVCKKMHHAEKTYVDASNSD